MNVSVDENSSMGAPFLYAAAVPPGVMLMWYVSHVLNEIAPHCSSSGPHDSTRNVADWYRRKGRVKPKHTQHTSNTTTQHSNETHTQRS